MNDPIFLQECQGRGITYSSLVYQGNSTLVYRGLYDSSRLPIAIKHLHHLNQSGYDQAVIEFQSLYAFRDEPHVVQVYDSFGFPSNNAYSFVIIQEWLDKDLGKEIEYRAKSNYSWTEAEIMEMSLHLIVTLATIQERGLAHRDIKPQNIFVDIHRQLKVGDFGSSRVVERLLEESDTMTVTGTPYYMSPELKRLMMTRSAKGYYNPYKSDVYSLGLTMLTAYKLHPPTTLVNLNTLTECTAAELAPIPSPDLRDLLAYMLAADSVNRPDFIQLRDYLSGPQVPVVIPVVQLAQCPHLGEGGQNFYQFECHGYFCTDCVSQVEQIGSSGDLVWYRAYCPMCSSPVEYWVQEIPQPNPVNPPPKEDDPMKPEDYKYNDPASSEDDDVTRDPLDSGKAPVRVLDPIKVQRFSEAASNPGEIRPGHHRESAAVPKPFEIATDASRFNPKVVREEVKIPDTPKKVKKYSSGQPSIPKATGQMGSHNKKPSITKHVTVPLQLDEDIRNETKEDSSRIVQPTEPDVKLNWVEYCLHCAWLCQCWPITRKSRK